MSDPTASQSPEVSALVSVFMFLRRHEGLRPDKLTGSRAQPLLHLPAVAGRPAGADAATTAVEVVRDQVRALGNSTDRIIADAVLGLGVFAAEYEASRISRSVVGKLARADLGVRRATLLSYWNDLHRALSGSDDPPVAPRDRILRGRTEEEVFGRLAVRLLSMTSARRPDPVPVEEDSPSRGKVVVVGGVTIDHVWQVERPPDLETSRIATGYSRSPGGKGLSQAIAVARLGFDVSLLAAVGSDREGEEILDHLELEGVDTSLTTTVANACTPATGIFERPFGESSAAVWRGALEVDSRHLDRHAGVLSTSSAVLLTFEVPPAILHRALDLAESSSGQRPLIIVTPGQPYPGADLSTAALRQIDYLVARPWELEQYARSPGARYNPELISKELLKHGLNAVCILGTRGGTAYLSTGDSLDIPATPSVIKESSITRDAFCAALATGLLEHRPLPEALRWSAAAMAAVAEDYLKSPTPPLRTRVHAMYQKHFA